MKFAGIYEVPSNDELSRFISQFRDKKFINSVNDFKYHIVAKKM